MKFLFPIMISRSFNHDSGSIRSSLHNGQQFLRARAFSVEVSYSQFLPPTHPPIHALWKNYEIHVLVIGKQSQKYSSHNHDLHDRTLS